MITFLLVWYCIN